MKDEITTKSNLVKSILIEGILKRGVLFACWMTFVVYLGNPNKQNVGEYIFESRTIFTFLIVAISYGLYTGLTQKNINN